MRTSTTSLPAATSATANKCSSRRKTSGPTGLPSLFRPCFVSLGLLLVHQLPSCPVSADPVCHICGDYGNSAMEFPYIVLKDAQRSCNDIAVDIAVNAKPNSNQCKVAQKRWHDSCCSGKRPEGSEPSGNLPPQNVPDVTYYGPHPVCNLCRDGDYPFAVSMVVNFLYIGEGSCAQYYKYGKEGRIQRHLCDPVQYFSYEPCGCGEFNPYFNPNHPLNEKATGQQQQPELDHDAQQGPIAQRRKPDFREEGKNALKISNGRGGFGGRYHAGRRKRTLKGSMSSVKSSSYTENKVAVDAS
jgi:hypothetical protein